MFSFSRAARYGAPILLALFITATARAQYGVQLPQRNRAQQQMNQGNPLNNQPQRQKPTKFQGEATIAAVAPGALRVIADGQPWTVHPDRNCKIQVTGSADVSALKIGQFVRFQGEFDNSGAPKGEISQIEIITPMSPTAIGVFPQGAAEQAGTPQAKKPAQGKKAPTESGTYLVVGKLAAVKDRELTVAAIAKPIQVQLADGATVHIDVADYSLAKAGDKVSVQGWYTQPGTAMAENISIVLSNPVSGPAGAAGKPAGPATTQTQ